MKVFLKLSGLALLPTLLFSQSCKSGSDPTLVPVDGIEFEISLQPLNGDTDGINAGNIWQSGDEAGVFAAASGEGLSAEGNVLDNARLVYNGMKWKLTDVDMIDFGRGRTLDFYVYYPYKADVASPFDIEVTAVGQDGLSSPVCQGSVFGAVYGADIQVSLSTPMSLVWLNVPVSLKGCGPKEDMVVTVSNAVSGYRLDLHSGSAEPLSDGGTVDIPMMSAGFSEDLFSFYAFVPSQNISAGSRFFGFVHEGWRSFEDTASETVELKSGTVSRFDMDISEYTPHTVLIEAGTFMMGSPESEPDRYSDETLHEVTLTQDFRMSIYEVTNAQYALFLNDTDVEEDGNGFVFSDPTGLKYNSGTGDWEPQAGYENHPVCNLSWVGADSYARWAGGVLPTEAQWEYACRAGTTSAYSFGDDVSMVDNYAWYSGNSGYVSHEVGTKLPNPWGLYDMHGNVMEWVSDWYGPFDGNPTIDPTGASEEVGRGFKVLRGGAWSVSSGNLRSAYRFLRGYDDAFINMGLRVIFIPDSMGKK